MHHQTRRVADVRMCVANSALRFTQSNRTPLLLYYYSYCDQVYLTAFELWLKYE